MMLHVPVVGVRARRSLVVHSGHLEFSAQSTGLVVDPLLRVASVVENEADHEKNQDDHGDHHGDDDAGAEVGQLFVRHVTLRTLPLVVASVGKI